VTQARYADDAVDELNAAVDYYADRDADLAARFHAELRDVEQHVADAPLSYAVFEEVGDVAIRRALLADFPYALLDVVIADAIWIIAVMHLRREPGYWRQRI
jgi:toxin ParE1/3/4